MEDVDELVQMGVECDVLYVTNDDEGDVYAVLVLADVSQIFNQGRSIQGLSELNFLSKSTSQYAT